MFHRGHHAPPPGVVALHGDRTAEGGLAALERGEWDVVDTWSDAPSAVRDAARLLAGRAGHYAYVSSASVYRYPSPAGQGEDGPLADGSADAGGGVAYPQAKRGGELAAAGAFGDRALLVRAGLVLGPGENIGRLPWWLTRITRGGPVLAPGPRDLALQYVDARDLAARMPDAAAGGLGGPCNLVGPRGHATMGGLLEECVRATGADARLRWTDPEVILAAGVAPWSELPVWVPPGSCMARCTTPASAGRSARGCAAGRWPRRWPTPGSGCGGWAGWPRSGPTGRWSAWPGRRRRGCWGGRRPENA